MASLNKVFFIGRLTRDPEARFTPSGAAVTEFGFAVNRYYTVNGERKEDTCFLDVNAWGGLGERVRNYLRKGSQVFIEGHLVFDQWQTQDGQKRSKIRVTANNIQFLDAPADRGYGTPSRDPEGSDRASAPTPPPPAQTVEPEVFPQSPETDENEAPF